MPIHTIPDHRQIPRLDEPATVLGLMVIVNVQCKSCLNASILSLIGDQPAVCERCGAAFVLDAVRWGKGVAVPEIRLSASPSRAKALV
jgi:hypothetical protein